MKTDINKPITPKTLQNLGSKSMDKVKRIKCKKDC